MTFPQGTPVAKVNGQDTLTVSGNSAAGVAAGGGGPDSDSSGTIRVFGQYESLTFTVTPNFGDGTNPDGIYFHLAASPVPPPPEPEPEPPPPTTENPPAPVAMAVETPKQEPPAFDSVVLSVEFDRPAAEVQWDLNDDGTFETSCDGSDTGVKIRPPGGEVRAADVWWAAARGKDSAGNVGPTIRRDLEIQPPAPFVEVAAPIQEDINKAIAAKPAHMCGNAQQTRRRCRSTISSWCATGLRGHRSACRARSTPARCR